MMMNQKWVKALEERDVEFWRKTAGDYIVEIEAELEANQSQTDYKYDYSSSSNCFLSHHHNFENNDLGNILHLAAGWEVGDEVFRELIRTLPERLVLILLTQRNFVGENPLHVAAFHGRGGIVRMIMGFYAKLNSKSEFEDKPWLAQDSTNSTPLHRALYERKQECALEILTPLSNENGNSEDLEKLCNVADNNGETPLFMAMKEGYSRVALQILKFSPSFRLRDHNGDTPLHTVGSCSEEVLKLVLEKHPDMIKEVADDGYTAIHKWILDDNLWPLEYIMKNVNDFPRALGMKRHLANLSYACDNDRGYSIFHLFAKRQKLEISTDFANIYREERARELASLEPSQCQLRLLPWLVNNRIGKSPFEIAMRRNAIAASEYDLLKGDASITESALEGNYKFLFVAIKKGLIHAAEKIWNIQYTYGWWDVHPPDQGREIWTAAFLFSEDAAIWIGEKLPSFISEPETIKYVLHSASVDGAARFIEWMLKKHPSALEQAPMVWVEACKRGHFTAVVAFINHCPEFREICMKEKDTPLHHINFKGYRQYLDFLKDPIVLALKNFQDRNGETPLHKSIRNRNNLLLTEVLLTTDDVFRSIEDNKHKTAMDLLVESCKGNRKWKEMCKRNGIVPELKTTYFQDKTNLLDARNALLVVAALVATITFTAGFTLPGGVQSDSSGKPILGNKAAFSVFLLADAVAMCSSMLVLVCLLWSMLCDHNKSLYLIDKSMPMLLVSLCSTLVAFMTGVYVVIPHKSIWSAIVVLAMCSIVIILSIPWIMNKILATLNLEKVEEYTDEDELMERGEATSLLGNTTSRIQERASSSIGGRSPRQH